MSFRRFYHVLFFSSSNKRVPGSEILRFRGHCSNEGWETTMSILSRVNEAN